MAVLSGNQIAESRASLVVDEVQSGNKPNLRLRISVQIQKQNLPASFVRDCRRKDDDSAV
jgi:hypothetical protein